MDYRRTMTLQLIHNVATQIDCDIHPGEMETWIGQASGLFNRIGLVASDATRRVGRLDLDATETREESPNLDDYSSVVKL